MPRYITPAGRKRLKDEFDYLWRIKRPQVTRAVAEAAAQGDRSENAEYIYGKKQLRQIDSRIRFLSKRLDDVRVVDQLPADRTRVFFGAWVELLTESGEVKRFRIVGADEFDSVTGYISIDSPMARALLKKTIGDEVEVRAPAGNQYFQIRSVDYPAPDP